MACVVDASFLLSLLLPDETVRIDAAMDLLLGGRALAPAHCATEVANGLLVAHRRSRITFDEMTGALTDAAMLGITVDSADGFGVPAATVDLALAHKLTIYDAAYLELALRRRVTLATFDAELRAAAARENVSLFE